MLGPDDLVLCAATLSAVPLGERIEAAAEAGFTGLSLFADDYERARADGHSDHDLRARLADRGLSIGELDPLLTWVPGAELGSGANEQGTAFFRYGEGDFYRIADAIGARSINAVLFADQEIPRDDLAEAFAGLCDRANERGLLVHLEFMPFTQVRDARAALEITSLADRPNGGIMLDTWHHYRGGANAESLAGLAIDRVLAVQISDAPREAEPDVLEETMHRRRVPGEGDADLAAVLAVLAKGGAPAPMGVEIFSDALAALPAKEAAQRVARATRALLEQARSL